MPLSATDIQLFEDQAKWVRKWRIIGTLLMVVGILVFATGTVLWVDTMDVLKPMPVLAPGLIVPNVPSGAAGQPVTQSEFYAYQRAVVASFDAQTQAIRSDAMRRVEALFQMGGGLWLVAMVLYQNHSRRLNARFLALSRRTLQDAGAPG
jgi:hypothetical protein